MNDDLRTTQTCRYCSQEFPINVMVCQHCGREKPSVAAMRAKAIAVSPSKKPASFLKIVLIIAAVVVFGCCGGIALLFNSAIKTRNATLAAMTPEQRLALKTQEDYERSTFSLKREASEMLRRQLKAPKDAEIELESVKPDTRMLVVYLKWTVTSQKSFGAKLTKPVQVVYGRRSTTGEFKLVYYQFESDPMILDQGLYDFLKNN